MHRSAWRNCLESRNKLCKGVPKAVKRGQRSRDRTLLGTEEARSRGLGLFSKQFRKGYSRKLALMLLSLLLYRLHRWQVFLRGVIRPPFSCQTTNRGELRFREMLAEHGPRQLEL